MSQVNKQPGFDIKPAGPISNEFLARNIHTFQHAANFVQQLPYGRNTDKTNLKAVFTDNCGTCSTKHALLKTLADENNFDGFELVIGLFKMNATNTPRVANTLKTNGLEYIPEAHCYLKSGQEISDFTGPGFHPSNYANDLLEEKIISPDQITAFKVAYQKNYLESWITKNKINITMENLWTIREQCIVDLGQL
jgi:hypothetical protein